MKAICCIVGCLAVAVGLAQPQFEVVDLTKMFGEEFSARDINNAGLVVGSMRLNFSQSQACIVQGGKLTMLPMFAGKHPWTALAINDSGDVLGAGNLGTSATRSVLFKNGKVFDIGIPGNPEGSAAQALSESGKVTGWMDGTPFIWDDGVVTVIPGGGYATDINRIDTVVGFRGASGLPHAARWAGGVHTDINPTWAEQSRAASINEVGEVVGEAWGITGGQHGFLWRNGEGIQLPNFGGGQSRAYDINDMSQVVGWASENGQPSEGFLWENDIIYRLTDHVGEHPGFLWLEAARSINNPGQILTRAAGGTQSGHHLLLSPVPEPMTIASLCIGLALHSIFIRRKRL